MKLSDTDFGQETREALSRVLAEDETIQWSGAPGGKSPLTRSIPFFIFAAFWIAIPSFMIWVSYGNEGEMSIELIFPCIFIVIGMLIPIMGYRFHKRQAQSAYVLTDKRAIILSPKMFSGSKIYTYPVEEDMIAEIAKKKDGSGSLIFDYSDVYVNDKPLPRGFLNVNNIEKPLRLLKAMGVKSGQESYEL